MRKIYASVDIGTSSIKIVTLEVFNKKYNVKPVNNIATPPKIPYQFITFSVYVPLIYV